MFHLLTSEAYALGLAMDDAQDRQRSEESAKSVEDDTVVVRSEQSGSMRCSNTASAVQVSLTHSVPLVNMSVESERSVKRLTRAAH